MFFLGLAFMLVETKSITQLSLLFGATWIVSAVVILVILMLAFAANRVVDRFRVMRVPVAYVGLVLALVLDYVYHVPTSSAFPPLVLSALSAMVCCLPVFFGGIIFSVLLSRGSNAVMLLAANVLGVAFGRLLENFCVVTGIKSLSLIAMGLYLLFAVPLIIAPRRKPQNTTTHSGETSAVPLS